MAEGRLAGRCRFPIEPWNTWSNVAYPIVGWRVWQADGSLASLVFAVAMTYLGVGSGLYHGFKRGWAAQHDYAGMYAVFGGMVAYALAPESPWVWVAMLLVGGLGGWLLAFTLRRVNLNLQMGVCLTASLVGALLHGAWIRAFWSLGQFALAMGSWLLDKRDPAPTKQYGHAVWHVLTARAIGNMFLAQRP